MKQMPSGKALRTVIVVCLVGLYFVLAVGVTLLGSSIYRAVAVSADENSTHRTALSYVANQVRRGDAESVAVGSFGGYDALRLSETTEGGYVYVTYIYCYEGSLRELYTEEGSGLMPEDGTALISLAQLDFQVQDGLISVTAGDSAGHVWSLKLYPKNGIEEVDEL